MSDIRDQAIEIVDVFLNGGYESEQKDLEMMSRLRDLLPDPEFERLLFWGPEGPQDEAFRDLTADQLVDMALWYQPTIPETYQ